MLRGGTSPGYLLIHGFLGSSDDWRDVVHASGGVREILAIDLCGHEGCSEALQAASFNGFVESLAANLRKRNIGPVHGVGYSLGGRIVLGLSQRYPDLFSAITLISTFPGYENEHERVARCKSDMEWARRLRVSSLPEVLRDWYSQPIFASEEWTGQFWDKMQSRCINITNESAAEMLLALSSAQMPSYWGFLENTDYPVTMIVGERDRKYVAIAHEFARRNQRGAVCIVGGAGHSVLLEKPVELAKLLQFQ